MNIWVKPLVTNVTLGKQPCYSKPFWWSFTGIKDILGKTILFSFPTSPIRYKQTEWQVAAIDSTQRLVQQTVLCFTKQTQLHGVMQSTCLALSCAFPGTQQELSNYRQSRKKSRTNYRLEDFVKLRLTSSFIYFLNLHPSMVCQNFSPRSNYWLICG